MTNSSISHPRLHALIGDVVHAVPEDIARELECALQEQGPPSQSSTFVSCLNAIQHADGEDGQPCRGLMLGASNHASLSRSLCALGVVLDLLHAAERVRVGGGADQQLGDFHTDGLIVAARQLVREASHCLAGSAA